MSKEINIKMSPAVASRITSEKDISDYFAYVERNMYDGQELTYLFPITYQDQLEKVMEDMGYTPGEYNYENVKRILGEEIDNYD